MTKTTSNAASMAAFAAMPRLGLEATKSLKIGFLGPLTGNVAAWGEPGRNGCLIWADWVNAQGGIDVGGERFRVEIISFDSRYEPDRAFLGAEQLILKDEVKFIMMLGGDTFLPAVQDLFNRHKMLVSTLLPSDLSPNTPYLIAPCEVHPIYNVTGVEWLAENRPELKTAAICAQKDSLGLPSVATYRAAFQAAKIKISSEQFFDVEDPDFDAIVASMLASDPDILCWDTAYEPFVHALTEAAFKQKFDGQIISCTCDNYQLLVERTSKDFMEGFIFQFPDFDDPALNHANVNFKRPNDFYAEFNRRYPGTWSAVSWEYASILDLWKAAVEEAGTFEPLSVLAALKAGGSGNLAFGEGRWWGRELFGIDNALVGDWPVVAIRNGKATIMEYRSIISWWEKHGALLIKNMRQLGQMWNQAPNYLSKAG